MATDPRFVHAREVQAKVDDLCYRTKMETARCLAALIASLANGIPDGKPLERYVEANELYVDARISKALLFMEKP